MKKIFFLLLTFFLSFIYVNSQTLSFTTNVSSVSPLDIVQITNTSTNIPANSSFKWTFTNSNVYFPSYPSISFNTIIDSSISFSFQLPEFDNSMNGESFTINLELLDENGNLTSILPYSSSLIMSSTINDIIPICHEPAYIPCNNIVCNGDFEWYNTPNSDAQIEKAEPWLDNEWSSDLYVYGSFVSNLVNNIIPKNTGTSNFGFAGFYGYLDIQGFNYHNRREYIQQELKAPLVTNQVYEFECDIAMTSFSTSKIDNLGFLLSNGKPGAPSLVMIPLSQKQDVIFNSTQVFNMQNDTWTHFKATFTAQDAYDFISIGHIYDDNNTQIISQPTAWKSAYYVIDNITLKPAPALVTLNDQTISCGSSASLQATNPVNVVSYQWFDGNNNVIIGATSSSLTVNPIHSTTYKLVVTNYFGCETEFYCTVNVNGHILNENLIDPEISQHSVQIPGTSQTYSNIFHYEIENPKNDYAYKWEVISGSVNSISNVYGTSNDIDWVIPTTGLLIGELKITQLTPNCERKPQIYKVSKHRKSQCIGSDYYKYEWVITSQDDIPLSSSEPVLYLEGVTQIQTDITLEGYHLSMAPNSKISISPNCTLTIENCTITAGCDVMWDGIFANSNTEYLNISQSTIEDAVYGVQSRLGGNLMIVNNDFDGNLYDIQLLEYKSPSIFVPPYFTPASISIYNNNFGSNSQFVGPPYSGDQILTNINISEMQNIQIGDASKTKNSFYNSIHGIKIFNSSVKIVNNEFNNIKNLLYFKPSVNRGAILINSVNNNYYLNKIGNVTIGGSLSEANVFNDCYTSITSNNSKVSISYNTFIDGYQSINIYSFDNDTEILNNTFEDAYFGIKVNNPLGSNRKITVMDNYFKGKSNNYSNVTREAINMINCNSQANSSIEAKVANNTINYTGQRAFLTAGIRIQNCNGIEVNSNFITRMSTPTIINNDWDKTIGLRVSTCGGAQIHDNYINGFGQSIKTYGNLTGTQFACNELLLYKYGFYWGTSTSLSNQGALDLINNHDRWSSLTSITGPVDQRLANVQNSTSNILNQNDIKWYYNPQFTSYWMPNTVSFGFGKFILPTSNPNGSIYCVGGSGGGGNGGSGTGTGGGSSTNSGSPVLSFIEDIDDPEIRDFMFEDILIGQEYSDLEDEYRAYDADYLYKMLNDDTTMMWLGGGRDADYREFFDSIQNANIGAFYEVYQLIDEGYISTAIQTNNSITPEQEIFENLQTVLGIYLESWASGRYDLTSEEYDILFDIANLTPYEGGVGVYTARIMIGFEPDENEVAYRLENGEFNNDDNNSLKLYPNPANDEITIEFKNEEFEELNAQIAFYSYTGKLIYKTSFQTNQAFKVLSVDMLKNGVYLYEIELSNGVEESGKLVILK